MVNEDKEKSGVSEIVKDFALLIQLERKLFKKLEKDYKDVKRNLKEQAIIV